MDWFAKLLLSVMHFSYSVIPNWGVAIILLTIVARTLMFPLTLKSMKSMKKMQVLAPEIKEIQEKYKDDQQEASRKMMELYRERGINPMGGCFPMLLQMPIFFALYRMLWYAYELRGAPFLWVDDLSQPDQLFTFPWADSDITFLHYVGALNILPLLGAAALLISQKLMPTSGPSQNPQQKLIMTLMPVMFTVFLYNMAAGLNLYILTSTVLGIGQNYLVRLSDRDVEEAKEKKARRTPRKRRDFYSAAQQRRRRIAKGDGARPRDPKKKDKERDKDRSAKKTPPAVGEGSWLRRFIDEIREG
jgi:YidC/Oxa1 family membrane protein insertase